MIKKRTVKRAAKVSILPTTGVLGALIAAFSHDSVRWLADLRHYLASSLNASAVGGNTGAAFYWSIGAGLISYALWPKFRSKVNAWIKGHLSLHHAAVTQSLAEHHASIAALLDEHVAAIHAHIEGAPVTTTESPFVPQRVAGKLGRKTGVSEVGSQFKLEDYLVDPLPIHDGPDDFTHGIVDWGMAGNDIKGDCGLAGDYHYAMSNAATAGETLPPTPDQDATVTMEILQAYAIYDGGQDNGVDLGQWLAYRMTHPLAGLPPIGGFAQVPIDGALFQSALHAFGGLYTGVLISPEAMEEFNLHQPFTSTATDFEGGHCVPILARDTACGKCITWGAVQEFSWEWWRTCREEAYVIFTAEMMNAPGGIYNGVKVAQLKADIEKLHGTIAPDPAVPPVEPPAAPEPAIPPYAPPVPVLADFLHELSAAAHEVVNVLDRYLHP